MHAEKELFSQHMADAQDKKLCWYCKQRPADVFNRYYLLLEEGQRRKSSKQTAAVKVPVPRCERCARLHELGTSNRLDWLFFGVPPMVTAGVIALVKLWDEIPYPALAIFVAFLCACWGGGLLLIPWLPFALLLRALWYRSCGTRGPSYGEKSEWVQELKQEGWRVGDQSPEKVKAARELQAEQPKDVDANDIAAMLALRYILLRSREPSKETVQEWIRKLEALSKDEFIALAVDEKKQEAFIKESWK